MEVPIQKRKERKIRSGVSNLFQVITVKYKTSLRICNWSLSHTDCTWRKAGANEQHPGKCVCHQH